MAFGLRFTDGTTTITVTTTTVGYVTDYRQGSADREKETVTDKALVLFVANLATVRTSIQTLNRLFQQAEERQKTKMGAAVYVERDLGDSVWWRSEITKAIPLPEDRTYDQGLYTGKIPLELVFTRKNYWEGAEAQLALTNGNGTSVTTALTVYNHDDAATGHDNWVSIAAADVSGDLMGPARLELANNYATNQLGDVWIGHNWTDPANCVQMYEAEDATGGTDTAEASCSGGYYSAYSLASGSETDMFTWTVSTAALNAAKGQMVRALLRFYSGTSISSVWFRLKAKWNATTIWQSERAKPSSVRAIQIRDLFSFRLPPWLQNSTSLDDISLVLSGYQVTGSAINVQLDYMSLMPADGWRYLTPSGYGVPNASRIMDDAVTGDLYVDNGSGSDKIGIYLGYGKQIHLYPNKLQRLYFLMHSTTSNTGEIARTLGVKVYYRPRRLTL